MPSARSRVRRRSWRCPSRRGTGRCWTSVRPASAAATWSCCRGVCRSPLATRWRARWMAGRSASNRPSAAATAISAGRARRNDAAGRPRTGCSGCPSTAASPTAFGCRPSAWCRCPTACRWPTPAWWSRSRCRGTGCGRCPRHRGNGFWSSAAAASACSPWQQRGRWAWRSTSRLGTRTRIRRGSDWARAHRMVNTTSSSRRPVPTRGWPRACAAPPPAAGSPSWGCRTATERCPGSPGCSRNSRWSAPCATTVVVASTNSPRPQRYWRMIRTSPRR